MLVKLAVMEMSPSQCRGARGLLDWSQTKLANEAGVGLSTVYDFEKGRREVSREKVQAMRIALELAGILFNADSVTLKRRRK
jgi:transcriptional regulator with XRE-family HTH domain